MTVDPRFKAWLQRLRRRLMAVAVVIFSRRFTVVGFGARKQAPYQVSVMPGHRTIVIDFTDLGKVNRLIKRLESVRQSHVHMSRHHGGASLKRYEKGGR